MTARRAFYATTAFVVLTWTAHRLLLARWEVEHVPPALLPLLGVLLRGAIWLLPPLLYLRRHDPRPLSEAFGLARPVASRSAWLVGLAWLVIAYQLVGGPDAPPHVFVDGSTFMTLVWAALEELLLRGFVLGQLLRFHRPLAAQVITATLFAALHVPAWLVLEGMGAYAIAVSFLTIAMIGGVLGFIRVKTGAIYLPFAVHVLSNLFADWFGPS